MIYNVKSKKRKKKKRKMRERMKKKVEMGEEKNIKHTQEKKGEERKPTY